MFDTALIIFDSVFSNIFSPNYNITIINILYLTDIKQIFRF